MAVSRIKNPPDVRGAKKEGGYWTMPATHFKTSSDAQDFAALPETDALDNEYPYARAISAGAADVTITLTPLNGGVPAAIFILAGTTKTVFYESTNAPTGGSVTHWF